MEKPTVRVGQIYGEQRACGEVRSVVAAQQLPSVRPLLYAPGDGVHTHPYHFTVFKQSILKKLCERFVRKTKKHLKLSK